MQQLSDFLLKLSRGAIEKPANEFKNWVLSEVNRLIPFDSAVWGMGCWIDDNPTIYTAHLYKLNDDFVRSWTHFQHEDKFARQVSRLTNKSLKLDVSAEYAGTDLYNNHCKHFGVEHVIGTGMTDPDTKLFSTICLYRADINKPFTETNRKFMELIFQHLVEAARTNWLSNLPNMLSTQQRSSFNTLAACEASGVLQVATPSFVDLCREEWADWIGPFLPKDVLEHFAIGRKDYKGKNVVLHHIKLKDLFLLRGRLKVSADYLSERELQVAREIAQGNDYKTIANTMGLSPSTVRTHVNNIFTKLNIADKARLVTELAKMDL